MYKMKKIATAFVSAISLTLIISGCSKAPAANAVTEASNDLKTSGRIVNTSQGDVEVPAEPKRVIATYGMGDLLALGVKPVATYNARGTAYEKEVADLPVWDKFESEEIMSYDPDLIFVVNQEQYDKVSKIAPTIMIPFTELSLEERVTYLGEVLNKEEEAKKALSEFKEKIGKAKETMKESGLDTMTYSIFDTSSDGRIFVYGDKWGRGGDLIYSQLKLKAPDVIQKDIIGKDQYRELSIESVKEYAGDYIILSGELGFLSDNPVWNSIPAVKAGHVIRIDHDLFYDIDLYSSNVQLDFLMKELTGK
ncbi:MULTISPECIES: ABC transporter substrate-binding protein [Clostridia]|jgi:iron complex transport system substrate-binding protein|uniref:ABC transporter substrate-binding protein n=1 Tax=Clostridia TaxID=186801 RepID=UPI0004B7D217|nr:MULTISPECIES: ABC transporter substrate-binding protein [Clostridia]